MNYNFNFNFNSRHTTPNTTEYEIAQRSGESAHYHQHYTASYDR